MVCTADCWRALGPERPFYALAPHGSRGTTVPDTVEAMAADDVTRLRAVVPCGPYALAGYCASGTVAYEMARQLRHAGETVEAVIMLNGAAKNAGYLAVHRLVHVVGDRLNLSPATQRRIFVRLRHYHARAGLVRRLRVGASVRRVRTLRRWSATLPAPTTPARAPDSLHDPAVHEAHARFPAITAAYIPRRYDGRVLLCTAITHNAGTTDDPTLGWGRFARDIAVHPFPGYQNDLVTTHVEQVAACIERSLDR